jgi:hypothetical protein
MQTTLRREYKGDIYVRNIRKNSCTILNWIRNRKLSEKSDPDPKKCIRIHNTDHKYTLQRTTQ